MARGLNKVMLIGNLGADPEVRYSASGVPVTRFRVATTDNWRDRQSGEMQSRTEWHSLVCFQRLAEIARDYLKKGSKVYIEGSLKTSSWQAPDGQKQYRTEITVRELQMLDGKTSEHDDSATGSTSAAPPTADQKNYEDVSVMSPPPPEPEAIPTDRDPDDDIPF